MVAEPLLFSLRARAAAACNPRWDTSIAKSPPQVSYDMACPSDEGRLELYSRVLDHGFTFLRDVPPVPGKVA
jgi:hypothetical protein